METGKTKDNKTLRFSLIQMAYSITGAGIVVLYLVPLYRYFGFSVTKIGILSAVAYISAIIAEPLMGRLCDKINKTYLVVTVAMIVGLIAFSLIYFFHDNTIILFLSVILLYGTTPSLGYLISQWSVKLKNNGTVINFGISRAAGSLGYGIFIAIFGKLIDIKGYDIILPAFVIFSLITVILLVTVKEPESEPVPESNNTVSIGELCKSGNFVLLALSAMFTFVGAYCITIFLSLRIDEIGGSISDFGFIFMIEGIFEVIAILLYEKIAKYISNYRTLMISFILSFISDVVISFAGSVPVMYAGMIIHGLFTGLYIAGIALYIPEIVDSRLTYTAAMIVASCLSVSAALSSLYIAIVTKVMNLQNAMQIAMVMPALAIVLFALSKKKKAGMAARDKVHRE